VGCITKNAPKGATLISIFNLYHLITKQKSCQTNKYQTFTSNKQQGKLIDMKHHQKKYNIGILGYGNMGKAILELFQKQSDLKKKANFFVYSLNLKKIKNATKVKNIDELVKNSDIIFLCLKPQDFFKLKAQKNKKIILISIMAGVSIARIKKVFAGGRVIRTMPNLPLQVGQGLIGWTANKKQFSAAEFNLVKKILSSLGKSIYVNNEKKIDAITAISGSGPAYVFLFINALIKAAKNLGFDKKQSELIVMQTMTGSLSYLQAQDNLEFDQLIKKVASKGGTTEAALKELGVNTFYTQWQKAISQARKRAKQLSAYESK